MEIRGLRFLLRRLPSPLLFPSLVFSVFPFRLCPATWFFSERPSKRLYPKIKEHSRLFGRMRWKGSSKQSEISQPEKGNNEKGKRSPLRKKKRRGEGRYFGKLCGYLIIFLYFFRERERGFNDPERVLHANIPIPVGAVLCSGHWGH